MSINIDAHTIDAHIYSFINYCPFATNLKPFGGSSKHPGGYFLELLQHPPPPP